jgi:hypothetical protein
MLVAGETGDNCHQSVIYGAAQRPQQDTNEKEREKAFIKLISHLSSPKSF